MFGRLDALPGRRYRLVQRNSLINKETADLNRRPLEAVQSNRRRSGAKSPKSVDELNLFDLAQWASPSADERLKNYIALRDANRDRLQRKTNDGEAEEENAENAQTGNKHQGKR